jgi:hypothetical protein
VVRRALVLSRLERRVELEVERVVGNEGMYSDENL